MPNDSNTLPNAPFNAYYYLIALLPGAVLTTYYAGLTRKDILIIYTDYSAIIKMGVAIVTALLVELIILVIKNTNLMGALKNPHSLLIGVLLGVCLPNNLAWWEVSSSVVLAVIVGRYLLNLHLHPVLVGYIFSLATFPATHGLSTILKSEVYNSHLWEINGAFMLGGLCLAAIKRIDWRTPITLLTVYSLLILTFKVMATNIPFSTSIINSVLTPTTCFSIFFIAPFVVYDSANTSSRFLNGAIIAIAAFLLGEYAHYPNALLITLLVANIMNWAWGAKNIPLNNAHITSLSSHVLLIPILSASVVMIAASSITQAAVVGAIVVVIYLGTQSMADVIKRYVSPSPSLSLIIVLTAFLSAFIGLSIKVNLPALSQTIDNYIPLLALSSLLLSCSAIFTGNQTPFTMSSALKTSALFLVLVLIVGGISQFTDANRLFCAGLFFLFALIALYNNPALSNIESPVNKPNRRVRTTGTIK